MNKSPEEYFAEQEFSALSDRSEGFSDAEKAFMEKYMGVEAEKTLQKMGVASASNSSVSKAPAPDEHAEMSAPEKLEDLLQNSEHLLMVAFYLGEQEFIIPTVAVQEVVRTMPLSKLPAAPSMVAGVINLRGKVTPVIRLREVLGVNSPRLGEDRFIVVCRRKGLQIGLLIERIHTMYNVSQADIEWGIESHLGANVDFVSGLLKLREKLIGIISVDNIISSILK